jgi:iron complex outermembrane receptor protein
MAQIRQRTGQFAPGVTAVALVTGTASLFAGVANAQQATSIVGLEEIVVTARKTEEKLTEVPVSIAAFTSEDLVKRNVTSLIDIAQYTAGFSFESYLGATAPAPTIRGLAQTALTNRDQNVGTFVDGVYVQQQGNIDFSLMDVERVEIVKGPQSAQYGRNTFSGAINWVSKKPELGQWDGYVKGTLGTDERRDIQGAINIPVWSDKLAIRLAGNDTQFDGTFKNYFSGSKKAIRTTIYGYTFDGTDGNVGGYDNKALQAQVRFRPIDDLTIDLMYYRSEQHFEAGAFTSITARTAAVVPALGQRNPFNCSPRVTPPAGYTGTFNQLLCGEIKFDESQVVIDPRQAGVMTHSDLMIGKIDYRFSDSLSASYLYGRGLYDAANFGASASSPDIVEFGDATVSVLAGGRPGLIYNSNPFTDQVASSHEFRLDGKVSDITWRLGTYHGNTSDIGASSLIQYRQALAYDPTGQLGFNTFAFLATLSTFTDKNEAVFGSIAVPFADTWTVEAEARQAKETRSQYPLNRTVSYKTFTPRVNLKWRPQPGWMFYGSVAKGTKSGGFNAANADVVAYAPEKNLTYELGAKQTLADNRLQLNYALFFVDWSDLQISVPNLPPPAGGSVIQRSNYVGNVKGATAKGVEFEGIWAVTDAWRLNVAASYVQSQFKDGTIDTTFGRGCQSTAPVCTYIPVTLPSLPFGGSDIGGNDLARQPRSKVSAGAEYRMPVFGQWGLSIRGDVNYQAKYYAENLNLSWMPARTVLNANVALTDDDGHWYASLWAKNLTDKLYAANAFAIFSATASSSYIPALGEGRTAGLTVRYNFK